MGGALGRLLCLLRTACFEKNFLDLSMDGRHTGTCTTMPTACCLLPEELSIPFCRWEVHWDAHYYAYLMLPAFLKKKHFLRRPFPQSVCELGCLLRAAYILKKKNFLRRNFQDFPKECVLTRMLNACCLPPKEEKVFEKKFPGVSNSVCA